MDFEIDLAAEQLLAAEREGRKVAVQVKSFISPSNVSEFHTALGQFLNYRDALEKLNLIASFTWQFVCQFMKVFFNDGSLPQR